MDWPCQACFIRVYTDAVRENLGGLALRAKTVVLEFIQIVDCVNTVEEMHLGND